MISHSLCSILITLSSIYHKSKDTDKYLEGEIIMNINKTNSPIMDGLIFMMDNADSILDFNFRIASMFYNPNVPDDEASFFTKVAKSNLIEFLENKLSDVNHKDYIHDKIQELCDLLSLHASIFDSLLEDDKPYGYELILDKHMSHPETGLMTISAVLTDEDESEYERIRETNGIPSSIPFFKVSKSLLLIDELYKKMMKDIPDDKKRLYKRPEPIRMNDPMIDIIDERDVLVYTPYMSYDMVIDTMREICESPDIKSIIMTVYRLNDEDSKMVENLKLAAQLGKKVIVIMEERARGNEFSNFKYAQELVDVGCGVVLNNSSKKIHAKFITAEGNGKCYSLLSTGNFNEKTANIYTDFHYWTSDPTIAQCLLHLANSILDPNGYGKVYQNQIKVFNDYLHYTPGAIRSILLAEIHLQAARGKAGRIFIKCNNLDDIYIIEALSYAASQGVEIRMLVRSVCTMISKWDNCIIKNKIGMNLEHDRVYIFGGADSVYMGSADLMRRNLGERIETLLHVRDNRIANEIIKIFLMNWYDKNNLIEDKIDDQFIYLNSLIELEDEADERINPGSISKLPESSGESI